MCLKDAQGIKVKDRVDLGRICTKYYH
jgi:hypothetical protein